MTFQSEDDRAREHLLKIATPSRLAMHTGMEFMGRQWHPYPWLLYVEREILAMLQRPGREVLILSVPPQEGKTTYSGLFLPSWYLGFNPDNLVIFVAYNDEYAATWGTRVRNFIGKYGRDLFDVGLDPGQLAQSNWRTSRGFGGMLSVGILGGITGNPGHFIIIDDVIKTAEDAASPTIKRKHLDEWDNSISTRFQENTKVLITATIWAEDDLQSEIYTRSLEEHYDGIPVKRIIVKAEAEPSDVEKLELSAEGMEKWRDFLGRREGEFLDGQHSPGFFKEKKNGKQKRTWFTLYQGSPTSIEGSMFPPDRWGWYDPDDRPRMQVQFRIWDLAASEGEGDWTAGGKVGKVGEYYYILDMQRFRHSAEKVKDKVKSTAMTDGWGCPIRIEEERAGAGKSVVEFYRVELRGRDIDKVKAEGEKVSRFTPYSTLQRDGLVLLPRRKDGTSPEWVPKFIEEHKQQQADGRGPRYDDQIDVCAYAILEMLDRGETEVSNTSDYATASDDDVETFAERLGYQMAR